MECGRKRGERVKGMEMDGEEGERERTHLMTVCMPFTCDFPADGKM